jgi:hypothetical protein
MSGLLSSDSMELLQALRISVDSHGHNAETNMNAALDLILHITDCVSTLQQVNSLIPPDQLELTGGVFTKMQIELFSGISRVLMFIMSTRPNASLKDLFQILAQKILRLFPESAGYEFRNGTSLLHHAVSKPFVDVTLIQTIYEANPVCAGNPDAEGALPLHRAVANPECPVDIVRYLMEVSRHSLSSSSPRACLPVCLPVCLPACLPAYLSAYSPVCLLYGLISSNRSL